MNAEALTRAEQEVIHLPSGFAVESYFMIRDGVRTGRCLIPQRTPRYKPEYFFPF